MAEPTPFEPRNPYKGLRAFTGDDTGDFFGRERLIGELTDALRDITRPGDSPRFLAVVIGPSGSGKSSVVMAGLLPHLQRGGLPGSEGWVYLPPIVPGAHPLESLALTLADMLPQRGPSALADELKDDAGRGLHLLARQISGRSERRVVLLVDQFEELFTLTVDETERRRFIDLLVTAVTEPRGALLAILTLRADFYDRPLNYPGLGALLEGRSKAVLPMEIDDLRAVIEKPAALTDVHLTFEDGLVGDLLFEVRGEAAALPLLQFTLDQLFERREGLRLTRHAYQAIGGVRGALAKHAENTFGALPTETHRQLARALFLRLIEPGTTEQNTTRRRAASTEITLPDPTQTRIYESVARAFIDARLLTTGKVGEVTTIEVSHEALIREWGRLGEWLTEARDDIHLQKAISTDAAAWTARGRDPVDDGLYRGLVLVNAQDWAARNISSAEEIAFIETSAERQVEVLALEERRKQELIEVAEQARAAEHAAKIAHDESLITAERANQAEGRATLARRTAAIAGVVAAAFIVVAAIAYFSAQYSVADANKTLTPIPQTISAALQLVATANQGATSAAGQVAVANQGATSAAGQVADANQGATSAAKQVAVVNATLTPAFKTQVAISTSIIDSQARNDALHWAAQAGDLGSKTDFTSRTEAILLSIRALRQSDSPDAEASLYKALNGHNVPELLTDGPNRINAVAFSPDGRRMLTGSDDGLARLWDVDTAQILRVFRGHTGSVRSVAFSPDGKFVLTGSADTTAMLWKIDTGRPVQVFAGHTDWVRSVAFSPDGKSVLTGSDDNTAQLWDANNGDIKQIFKGHTDSVTSVTFSPDGRYILTGSGDKTAQLWDVSSGLSLRTFRGHTSSIYGVAFSPDGRYVLAGGYDGTARLWDSASTDLLRLYDVGRSVLSVAFSPDGKSVLTGSGGGAVQLWDVNTAQSQQIFQGHNSDVNSVAFSPDGRYILTGSSDYTARLWDASAAGRGQNLRTYSGHTDFVRSVAFSPDGRYALVGGDNYAAQLWDMRTRQLLRLLVGHTSDVTSVAFSPDGHYALTGSDDKTARLWDVNSGQSVRTFIGHTKSVSSVTFSPDGKSVLTGSDDKTARLWDVVSGQLVQIFRGHEQAVSSVAFSPNGESVLTGSYDDTARIWDTLSGKPLKIFSDLFAVVSVAFAPDGKSIVMGGGISQKRGSASIWDIDSEQRRQIFDGYDDLVISVSFAPDGKSILIASADGTVELRDVSSGRTLRIFNVNSYISSASLSPDGRYILTGGDDGTAGLWPLDYRDVVADACRWLPRDFTLDERQTFGVHDVQPTCPQLAAGASATPIMPTTPIARATWTPSTVTPLPPLTGVPTLKALFPATVTPSLPPSTATASSTPTSTATLAFTSSLTQIASPTDMPTDTPAPTHTPAPTVTFVPGAFDLTTLARYEPNDHVFTLSKPAIWTAEQGSNSGGYSFYVGASDNPQTALYVVIGDPTAIYQGQMSLAILPSTAARK